jgi:hypothetical protein
MRARSGAVALAVAALLAGGTLPDPAGAEETGPRARERGGKGYFMIGWAGLDLDELNDALAARGYQRFGADYLSLGGGGHSVLGRFVVGGQGHGLLGGDGDARIGGRDYQSRLRAGAGFFDVGVVALSRGGFSLTPLVGIGAGGFELRIRERTAPSFDDVLVDPGRAARLANVALLVDLGVTADFVLHLGRDRRVQGGPVFGIRAGYVLAPASGGWRLEDQEVAGGPKLGITGPYVRVLLGGGGVRTK